MRQRIVIGAALATSGKYVCHDVNTPESVAAPVQAALNAMNCDTGKPITVNGNESSSSAVVCCVQK